MRNHVYLCPHDPMPLDVTDLVYIRARERVVVAAQPVAANALMAPQKLAPMIICRVPEWSSLLV